MISRGSPFIRRKQDFRQTESLMQWQKQEGRAEQTGLLGRGGIESRWVSRNRANLTVGSKNIQSIKTAMCEGPE